MKAKIFGVSWLCTYCAFIIGLAAGQVGEIPKCQQEPNSSWLPVAVFVLICIPTILAFALGYKSGKGDHL